MLGSTGLGGKKKRKRAGSGLGKALLTCVFTILWFVVSGVVFSGWICDSNQEI